MKLKYFIFGAIGAALLQSAALGKIIYDRANLISSGKEVVIQSAMVDPRDLFRGHYVTLNLTVGTINDPNIPITGELQPDGPVYVELKKGDEEFWVAKHLYAEFPEGISEPVIKGKIQRGWSSGNNVRNMRIRFPFDRFFAEKGQAKDLEKVRRDRKLGVVLAVGADGEGAIKGISVEGEVIYNEPVW
ncbi:MAG: GDYXXLXY domain-containing protein [Salaquimonas sp.]